jgi:hypothetical protein
MAQQDIEIQYMGTEKVWDDVNTKSLQGLKFYVMRREVMGIPVDHYGDVKTRRTHPLLIPEEESIMVSRSDTKVLKKIEIVAPVKRKVQPGKGTKRGAGTLIPAKLKPVTKKRSVLDFETYSPGSGPRWTLDKASYPSLYKTLLAELEGGHKKCERDSRWPVLPVNEPIHKYLGSSLLELEEGVLLWYSKP